MPENLFCESFFIIWYTVGNKIKAITLVDICAIGFGSIDEKLAKTFYHILEIQPQCLTKPKPI